MMVLLLANTVLTSVLWFKSSRHKVRPPMALRGKFLIDQLNFDSSQNKQFDLIKTDYFSRMDELKEKEHELKDEFFDLIKSDNVSEQLIMEKANATAAIKFQIDTMMVNHFRKIKSICNEKQIKILFKVIDNFAKQTPFPARKPFADSLNKLNPSLPYNEVNSNKAFPKDRNFNPEEKRRFRRPPPPDLMEAFDNDNPHDGDPNQRPPHPRPPKRPRERDHEGEGDFPDGPPPPGPPPVE